MQTKKTVSLKDNWRVISDRLLPQHQVDAKLVEAQVSHVVTREAFNNVDEQLTKTNELRWETWKKSEGTRRSPFRKFQHYRLLLCEFARSIQLFTNVRELVQAFRDALEAHRHAHDRANILHRNISSGNIMINGAGQGLLVDWDLSQSSAVECMGTWQFMAARLLELPKPGMLPPIPNRDDDLESFWHVLLWTALKRCEHELSLDCIQSRLQNLFDSSYIGASGQIQGGSLKQSELGSQSTIRQMRLGSEALVKILMDVAKVLDTRYPTAPHVERGVIKVDNIWKMIRSENPHFPELDLEKLLLLRIVDRIRGDINWDCYSLWDCRRTQKDVRWMENIFQTALDNPRVEWDVGSANIKRRF